MEALQFSTCFSVNIRAPCTTQNWIGTNRRSKPTFRSAFTGSNNSACLSSTNPSTREIWSLVKSKTISHGRGYRRNEVRAEMFGQLTSGIESAWSKLKGEEVLTKDNIAEPMRDIRRALLEADVSLPIVRRFVQTVIDQAVGMGVIRGVKPDQQLVKVSVLKACFRICDHFTIEFHQG